MDLGCGNGDFSAAAARLTRRRVVAVDSRAGAVAGVRDACRGLAVRGVLAPAAETGLSGGSAAVVLCLRLLGQAADPAAVLAEVARLLAPAGLAVVGDWADIPAPDPPAGLVWAPLFAPPGAWVLAGRHGPAQAGFAS